MQSVRGPHSPEWTIFWSTPYSLLSILHMVANDGNVPDSVLAHARSLEWLNLPSCKLSKLRQTLSHSLSRQCTIFQRNWPCVLEWYTFFVAMASVASQSCEVEARNDDAAHPTTRKSSDSKTHQKNDAPKTIAAKFCIGYLWQRSWLWRSPISQGEEFPCRPVTHQWE